ncbi:Protein of unknown function (DUF2029) [Mycolicibacterium rhodesiae NBB3]|uniref:DUF2029 domain-containing protein n=2 Tax=Mycolicibacterium rhodesiae TaxID=36814 RepID=G8RIW6_MYCRN|nr:Protein of unknown function (DUF2029) [Mycolicibacterium rhodesiae NBB3]
MNQRHKLSKGGVRSAARARFARITDLPDRTVMLGAILLGAAVSAGLSYFLAQIFSIDVFSSLLAVPEDCWLDWDLNIGRHCFSDYAQIVPAGLQPNPWTYEFSLPWGDYEPFPLGGPAGEMVPHMLFGFPAHLVGSPRLGLIGYMFALVVAVLSPAVWAARGTHGVERVVVFVALGAAAIPAWAVIDRGNSAGFLVPIALLFLVALSRRQWRLAAIMVVLAALVKPWFVVLVVALFVARQWRWGGLALAGVLVSNVAAYLLWPQDFPKTIMQSINNVSAVASSPGALIDLRNVSFGRALLLLPDTLASLQGGKVPDGFLAGPRSIIGYAILALVVVALLILGRRIPPLMAGIVLLATAALSPPIAYYYYLIFVLPIAAIVVRSPDGSLGTGIFEHFAANRERRRLVAVSVSLATAFTIVQIALPTPPIPAPIFGQFGARGIIGTTPIVLTTSILAPLLWLIACVVVIISYARRPVHVRGLGDDDDPVALEDGSPSTSADRSEAISSHPPAED